MNIRKERRKIGEAAAAAAAAAVIDGVLTLWANRPTLHFRQGKDFFHPDSLLKSEVILTGSQFGCELRPPQFLTSTCHTKRTSETVQLFQTPWSGGVYFVRLQNGSSVCSLGRTNGPFFPSFSARSPLMARNRSPRPPAAIFALES